MSVDFFDCDECGESICDCGSWWSCEECGHRLCDDCEKKLVTFDDDDDGEEICPFCAKLTATDSQLLEFALGRLSLTREQLFEAYQNEAPAETEESSNESD